MPIGPTNTKKQKQAVVHTEMHKFKHGDLHSGSKSGPVVKSRKQAIAIALSESGQSHKKAKPQSVPPAKGPSPAFGKGESIQNYDRSSHFKGNPGFPAMKEEKIFKKSGSCDGYQKSEHMDYAKGTKGSMANEKLYDKSTKHGYQPAHYQSGAFSKGGHVVGSNHSASNAHAFSATNKSGALRVSGSKGAHQIGKRK